MVKNIKGGKGSKLIARKNIVIEDNKKLILPNDINELFGVVIKIYGNNMCQIQTKDKLLLGHIRKKFRERNKYNNSISIGSFCLIGLRHWELIPKNCDILHVYNSIHLNSLLDISDFKIIYDLFFNNNNNLLFNNNSNNLLFNNNSNNLNNNINNNNDIFIDSSFNLFDI